MPNALPLAASVPPPSLPIMRARVSMRLLGDTRLPAYKGGMLRGGFGYAFQQISCPQICWGRSETCPSEVICPFRWVFATPHPDHIAAFHDLQDVPRPFVIEPPDTIRQQYRAGETLEFHLVLIGRGFDYLPYFLLSFEQLGTMGLGADRVPARLERVEALEPWSPVGQTLYLDGQAVNADRQPTLYDSQSIAARAAALAPDVRLTLHTPLRLKSRGEYLRAIDPAALIQGICWRLSVLSAFHSDAEWAIDHRAMVAMAREIRVEQQRIEWVDWERTSLRHAEPQHMKLGGIIGSAVLHDVPLELRALLLAGELVHIGKACVFGHGRISVTSL